MVPFLLLLLLHESQTARVCSQITGHTWGLKDDNVTCQHPVSLCYRGCTIHTNDTPSRQNYTCFNASMMEDALKTLLEIFDYSIYAENLCNRITIHQLFESLKCTRCGWKEMLLLFERQELCGQLSSDDQQVKADYIRLENQLIHNIMELSIEKEESFQSFDLKALSINVFKINNTALNSLGAHDSIHTEAPRLPSQNVSLIPEVRLPVSALINIPEETRIIGLVVYKEHHHFQFHQEKISSQILRIEVFRKQLQNLKPPIRMVFNINTHQNKDNDSQLMCHYFDEDALLWRPDGCETINIHFNQTTIICHCNHATAFSVLLVKTPIPEADLKILSYISYIGCGLSAFFTALSLVIFLFYQKYKLDHSVFIHVSLSAALFLMNTTFLLTEWGATVQQEWVCVFVASFMHYSLLCCFTWMAIEGLHLYILLINVFKTNYKHYRLKLSLGGWGIPGIIVSVSLGVKDFKQFYGFTEIKMTNTNKTSSICWITDDTFFYSVNLLYFTIVFVFNFAILLVVASRVCRMTQVPKRNLTVRADKEKFSASCKSAFNLLGLTCLMGTTWGLAFLGSGYFNSPILYLFCILNSTQGFFLFLWICLSTKNQRKRDEVNRISSAPVTTSGKTSG